ENLFLTEQGWDARYVPFSIERQPFLIGFQETTEDGIPRRLPVVSVDMEHPKVSTSEGEPVFLPHGGESPFLERINEVLNNIHMGHEANKAFSRLLVGLDLIESVALKITLIDGSEHNLEGLFTINEDKLRELNGSALESLHRPGFLHSIYMMMASMPNLGKLIDRKNRALAAAASDA
ncbi:MAG: SapC family protein, partial [Gammaproteobacteria bacterium]|nr:SapC family protein [Gammaproteobacteria bacterium]